MNPRLLAVLLLVTLTSLAGYMGGWTVREGNVQNGLLMLALCAAMSVVGAAISVKTLAAQAPVPARGRDRSDD